MACGSCARRKAAAAVKQVRQERDLNGGYANLTDRQLKARLELYKKRYCADCEKRYECDYTSYLDCKKNK